MATRSMHSARPSVVGFDSYVLEADDAITFDANTPHRLCNSGTEPAVSVWFQLR